MNFISLNSEELIKKYQYPVNLGWDTDNFNGHQKGICIGMIKTETGEICQNYLPDSLEDRNKLLKELINDDKILKAENEITQLNEGKLERVTIYYLPYRLESHSVYRPTINYENIVAASNVINHIKAEVLLVYEGLNRYITLSFDTINVPVIELVLDSFQDIDGLENNVKFLSEEEATEDMESGYYLDFYNEVGDRFDEHFKDTEDMVKYITSIRLIEICTEITEDCH